MRTRLNTGLAAGLLVTMAACSGDSGDPLQPPVWVPPITAYSPTVPNVIELEIGLGDVWDFYNNGPINCTANDTNLFATVIAQGQADPTCYEGDELDDILIVADVISTAKDRYDISAYIAQDREVGDPTSALVGPTTFFYFEAALSTDPYSGTDSELDPRGPNTGIGANGQDFLDADGDLCGAIEQDIRTRAGPITLRSPICQDTDADGLLDVGSCVAYDNNANNPACVANTTVDGNGVPNVVRTTAPNTGSKCKCGPLNVPITVLKSAKIEVIKDTDPEGYGGNDWQLYIDKGALPGDAPELVEFTSGAVGDGGTTGSQMVYAGTQSVPGASHTVEEVFLNGSASDFNISISCVDRGETTFDGGAPLTQAGIGPLTVPVDPDDDIVCTITNAVKPGTIIVEKQTLPDGSTQSFTFTGDAAGSISDGQQITVNNLTPGQYTSTETVPGGWGLTSIVCDDANSTGNTGTGVATFNVEPDETVKCVFTNTEGGSITIEKQTVPDGSTQAFSFAGDVSGSLTDGQTATQNVTPGQYTSTETVPAGWDLTGIVCDDANSSGDTNTATATFNVEPGEDVKCTFTNTERGSITIEKQTLPDGSTQAFGFAGDVSGSLTDGQTASQEVVPGQYTSTETVPAGWDLQSIVCDDANSTGNTSTATATFNVEPGEDVKCTFTNRERSMVNLIKTFSGAVNSALDFDFAIYEGPDGFGGTQLASSSTLGDADGVLEFGGIKLDPTGTYTICELGVPAGWTVQWSVDTNGDGIPDASVTPYNPNADDPIPEDLGNRCADFGSGTSYPLSPGETLVWAVNNIPPPEGDPRTIGYWKNWSTCSGGNQQYTAAKNGGPAEGFFLIDDVLPLTLGAWVVDNCEDAVSILDKRDVNSGKKMANDAAYALAAQLLAAKANTSPGVDAGCTPADFATKVAEADALLTAIGFDGSGSYLRPKDAEYSDAQALASYFDDYNNGLFCAP